MHAREDIFATELHARSNKREQFGVLMQVVGRDSKENLATLAAGCENGGGAGS